jgi:hypothetical protein
VSLDDAIRCKAELLSRSRETLRAYEPLPKVLKWHKAKARIRTLFGGNRAGKTTSGAIEVGWYATHTHPYRKTPDKAKILCVEDTWSLIADPMWRKLAHPGGLKTKSRGRNTPPILPPRIIDHISWLNKGLEQPEKVFLKNGATITFKPCEAGRKKFEGAENDLVWLDEELSDTGVFQEIIRSLVDSGGDLISTATPLARGRPLLMLHDMSTDPDSPLEVYETFISILDNPYIDEKAKQAFIATIPEEYRATRIYGEFLILEGLVYKEWTRAVHELPASWRTTLKPNWPRVIVIDPGYHDPCAVLWAAQVPGPRTHYVAYQESYRRGRSVSQTVKEIKQMSAGQPIVKIIIDPNSRATRGQHALESVYHQYCRLFQEQGPRNARTGGVLIPQFADNDIRAGIYCVKEFLQPNEDGIPGFQMTDDLPNLRREFKRYAWPLENEKKNSAELPIDKDNHLLDGVRYLCMSTPLRGFVTEEKTHSEHIWEKAEAERMVHSECITIGGMG